MAKKSVVKFTANFEHNLEDIEQFLTEQEAPQAFDNLLDELLETVIVNQRPIVSSCQRPNLSSCSG